MSTSEGFSVQSSSPLTVTAVAGGEYSGIDVTNILQIRRLGFDRYVLSNYEEGFWFTLLASHDSTNVSIYSAEDLKDSCGFPGPPDHIVQLDRLEAMAFKDGLNSVGRSICLHSTASIAVFMTSGIAYVPYQGSNTKIPPYVQASALFEQLIPADFLGNTYVLPSLNDRLSGGHPEMYTVISAQESGINDITIESGFTSLYASSRTRTLKYGQYLDFDVDPGLSVKVSCSGACSVLGLHHRQGQDGVETGPFMFLVPPMRMQKTVFVHDELYSVMDILIRPEMTIIREAGETVTSDQGYITGFSPLGIDSSLEVAKVQMWDNNIQTVTASGNISAIVHGHNYTLGVGTFASVNTGIQFILLFKKLKMNVN